MEPDEVGLFRRCPACGRPVIGQAEDITLRVMSFDHHEGIRCSCCERPWTACPCSPVEAYFLTWAEELQSGQAKAFARAKGLDGDEVIVAPSEVLAFFRSVVDHNLFCKADS